MEKILDSYFDEDDSEEKYFVCTICLENIENTKKILINDCNHYFCNKCLSKYFLDLLDDISNYPFRCPFLISDGEKQNKCPTLIEPFLVLSLLESAKEKEKFFQISLKKFCEEYAEEIAWCSTPGCDYGFLSPNPLCQIRITCPLCKKTASFNTMKKREENLKNSNNEEEKKFQESVVQMKMKKCPNCKAWVEKNKGCNHIICKCGANFCYLCGENLEPNSLDHICKVNQENVPISQVYVDTIHDFYGRLYFDNPKKYVYKSINKTSKKYSQSNKSNYVAKSSFIPLKSDGTPDMRYSVNKLGLLSGPKKSDGTLDMRFKENKKLVENLNKNGPKKKDGTLDMRFSCNKAAKTRASKRK